MHHTFAGILMCQAAIRQLEAHRARAPERYQPVLAIYRERLERRRERLASIHDEFPGFYRLFERRLFERTLLVAAQVKVQGDRQHGGIGSKAAAVIARRIEAALARLPPPPSALRQLHPADLIRKVPLFSGLEPGALERLAARARQIAFLPEDTIIAAGQRGDALYIVTRGRVRVLAAEQEEHELATLGEGEFFGEAALLGDQRRTATVRAVTPATLLRLSRPDVLELAAGEPAIDRLLQQANAVRQQG